jgi:HAD superfamily hydrolase (TIGR01490 family)
MDKKQSNVAEQDNRRIAAFFDLDGTLTPLPSLEQRYFRVLRYRRAIPARNYWAWLKEAMRLSPRGIQAIAHANKMYLRGVPALNEGDGHNARWLVPPFFPEAIERVEGHAEQGHAIVIVSGTLEPLANVAARTLEMELAAREIAAEIRVCATRLEENGGRWTGRMLDEAMFGEAKARAVRKLVQELKLDLSRCWAYGDTANDQWMLAAVGNPTAVNPSRRLARIARRRGWSIARWKEKDLTQRSQRTQRTQGREVNSVACGLSPSALGEDRIEIRRSSSKAINSGSGSLG